MADKPPANQDPSNSEKTPKVVITSLAWKDNVQFFPYDFEFDDNFKPEWNSYDAFGRMDPVMIYKKTSRDATLSFNVVSNSHTEAVANFEKLQRLINFLYPQYSTITAGQEATQPAAAATAITSPPANAADAILTINKAPLMKIKFMNLLKEDQYVIVVTNFKHKLKFDVGGTRLTAGGKAYPGEFNISLSFKILHNSILSTYPDFTRIYG